LISKVPYCTVLVTVLRTRHGSHGHAQRAHIEQVRRARILFNRDNLLHAPFSRKEHVMEGRFVEVYRLRAVQDMQACAGAWSRHKSMCKLCTVFRILSSLSFRGFRPDMNLIHSSKCARLVARIFHTASCAPCPCV